MLMCVAVVILHMENVHSNHEAMDKDDLRPADKTILNVLQEGRATKGMLVDRSEYSRNTIYNRLQILIAVGHVEVVHESTRLFELADDPRDDSQ